MLLPLLKVDFNPVSDFTDFVHNPYVSLPLGLDINKAVIYLWMTGAIAILVTLLVVRRGLKLRPDRRRDGVRPVPGADRQGRPAPGGHADLVPVRGHALRVHLDDEPDRIHPA